MSPTTEPPRRERYLGIDLGAETIKVAELRRHGPGLEWAGHWLAEHDKQPAAALRSVLDNIGWDGVSGAAVSGRFSCQLALPRVPTKQAQAAGFRFLGKATSATIISIGGHGFSVLELRDSGAEVFRENSRCSQGTGNFLRQLVQRFDLSIEAASALCERVENPAALSGRCPVILKTDMTHLANKGEDRARILAGLYDAVCENVQVLIKPQVSPAKAMLIGGISRSARIRSNFARFLAARGMVLLEASEDEALFLEALGAAALASERSQAVPALAALFVPAAVAEFDSVPALAGSLARVRRLPRPQPPAADAAPGGLILGFDIGSTGSKIVALDGAGRQPLWEDYVNTNGNPVAAAQALMRRFVESAAGRWPVLACAVTGSGREIVGSLLATCYGVAAVYVLNEIAAHAEGARHYDPRVDTIFEIGGQDAKYIRLAEGRVIDAAMNEACSAGTGSFIEEQGRKFAGIDGVAQLGQEAIASGCGVSLGQHCSVFMAEVIDEAVAAGVEKRAIIAGLYDSIVQNYLNRVKGSRSVGDVIFCQGMPFSADALAAAVARQTGSEVIVPPNPGTVGALGIALLASKEIALAERSALDPRRFLEAQVVRKDTFICRSARGCGGSGNRCRIERLATSTNATTQRFTWGGACSLWDKGTGKRKLPDLAPNPFREREELVEEVIAQTTRLRGRPTIAITDEFVLKGLFPFFATFLHQLGFDLIVRRGADQAALKRGIERANVPFCAPMQQFHGLVSTMVEDKPDFLFLPMLRGVPHVAEAGRAAVCPIVQGSPDVLRWDLGACRNGGGNGKCPPPRPTATAAAAMPARDARRQLPSGNDPCAWLPAGTAAANVISPVIDFGGGNLDSRRFRDSCQRLAHAFGANGGSAWLAAYRSACAVQQRFEEACLELGQRALAFCAAHEVVPIVVLGRAYTIYNKVLNSNVPAIIREQGALAIPVDCYPVAADVPVFEDMYWGYGQRSLRAAHQLRRRPGIYSLWCSNYSCGPDSFCLHFYSYIMQGRPFAVIETDGHAGDAGTKTRVEAFLHCVQQDRSGAARANTVNDFGNIERQRPRPADVRARGETVLIPRMGPGADILAAALSGAGIPAQSLPLPDRAALQLGRRYTSGKECVPMCITLGSLLQRLERERHTASRFVFLMPRTNGPCRFGVYNLLHKIVLERLGWHERVRVWAPMDIDYSEGMPSGLLPLCVAGWIATDVLLQGLHDVRPVENAAGAAEAVFRRYATQLVERVRAEAGKQPTIRHSLIQALTGRLFGCTAILRRAARDYAAAKTERQLPTVAVVGEIYVRCDPFANDFVIDKLERRGLRALLAPFNEWLEYADWCHTQEGRTGGVGARLSSALLLRTQQVLHATLARRLGWHARTSVRDSLSAAAPYLRTSLFGEAVLTVGSAVHEWRSGAVDGVVNVGPLECMPGKLAEAQLFHAGEREGLPSLSLPFNGDPLDGQLLDNFAFEVHNGYRRRRSALGAARAATGTPAGSART
ncbi:MAG: CoA activase [Deltaproteobacteria bacterium]|nr:CoA activase [Deltaproteobacteria bacterium]